MITGPGISFAQWASARHTSKISAGISALLKIASHATASPPATMIHDKSWHACGLALRELDDIQPVAKDGSD